MSTSHRDRPTEIHDVNCGSCQATNSVERRFCGRCGERLWEPCNNCATPNATDQQYCGDCGVDLHEAYRRRMEDITARLARFETLRQEGRYLEASAAIYGIEPSDDTRLKPLLTQVEARSLDLSQERVARGEEVARQFEQGQQALAEHDFAGALKILETIPVGLRDRPMNDALQTASEAIQEMQALDERIRLDLRAGAVDELLPQVNRLLELRPGDEQIIKLAGQLRQRQLRQGQESAARRLAVAKQLFLAGRYAQAAETVQVIADEHIPPGHRKLYDTVLEVDGVVRWLKQEPFLHPGLVGLVQRWQQLRPHDVDAGEMAERIRKRMAARPEDPRFALTWTRLPQTTGVTCPVQWWRGLEHIEVGADASAFQQSTQRFLVAYGLALQGLGLAALPLNLLRKRHRATWQKLSDLRSSSPPRVVWGCDLGTSGLKALQLRRDKDTDRLEVIDAVRLPHAPLLADAGDDQAVTERLWTTMARFVEDHVTDQAPLVMGCAGPRSLGRTFEIPRIPGKKAERAIAYEAKRQIPIPVDEIAYDWHAWPGAADRSSLQSVTLLAARREHVQEIVAACAGLPIKLLAIQSDCLALYNAAVAQFFAQPKASRPSELVESSDDGAEMPTLAILDVGADCSSLIVAAPHLVRHRSFRWGMLRLDGALMSRFHITAQQARQLRHRPTSARWMYLLAETIRDELGDLIQDVSRTLRAYEAEGIQAKQLLVTGGGSDQLGLFRGLVQSR
jgi:Tfp pilus assembly PilM family ATPase